MLIAPNFTHWLRTLLPTIVYIFCHIALYTETKHNVKLKARILQLDNVRLWKINVTSTDCAVFRN